MSDVYQKGCHGFVVQWLQQKLGCGADGDFGNGTKNAIMKLQQDNNLPVTGEAGENVFKLLGLPFPTDFERVLNLVAEYEGTGFDKAEGPHETGDDAGITWGIIGFTSNNGEIQEMLQPLLLANPQLAETGVSTLGGRWNEFMDCIQSTSQHALANAFLDGGRVTPALKALMKEWGNDPIVQKAQLDRAEGVYWAKAKKSWLRMYKGEPSLRGKGIVYDTCVQNGLPESVIRTVVSETQNITKEEDISTTLLNATLNRISARYHRDVISRKRTYIDGQGTVHGSFYDLDNYAL